MRLINLNTNKRGPYAEAETNAADYIEAYFDYIRLHFNFEECVKVFGNVTGVTLWQEFEKYSENTVSAPFVFWQCILTDSEKRKIAEYAYNYRKDFLM